jgi:hypothetical protein
MTSTINTTNLEPNYPIAGQSNDSQIMRANFTNIKDNLDRVAIEVTDLQNKVVLKAALRNSDLNNDMNGEILYRPQLREQSETYHDGGARMGSVNFDYAFGSFHKIRLLGDISITFSNFPLNTTFTLCGRMTVWFSTQNSDFKVALPSQVIYGTSVPRISNRAITFPANGDYLVDFISTDGGTSMWVAIVV